MLRTPGWRAGPRIAQETLRRIDDESCGGHHPFAAPDRRGLAVHPSRRDEALRLVRWNAGRGSHDAAALRRRCDRGGGRHPDPARALHAARGVPLLRRDGVRLFHRTLPERVLADPEPWRARRALLLYLP